MQVKKSYNLVKWTWVVITLLLVTGGFAYYKHHKRVKTEQASVIYYNILNALEKNDLITVQSQGSVLLADYTGTIFADVSRLVLAKIAVTANNLDLAEQYLQDLLQKSSTSPLVGIAKARLARILSAQGDYVAALKILEPAETSNKYFSLYAEIKGDIYLAQNLPKQAAEAYRQAKNALADNIKSPGLDWKISDLNAEEEHV